MSNVTNVSDQAAMQRVFAVDDKGNSQAPEQVHRGQVAYAEFGDNAILKRASECLGFAHDGLASIDNLRANPHPEHTPARHTRVVREAIDGFDRAWAERWDGTKAALKAEQRRVESELEQAANLKPNDKHFNAIVGTFSGLSQGQKARTLDQLIEAGDGPALAALTEAPLFVTGLSAEQRDGIKLRLYSKVLPEGLALRNQVARALDKFEVASITCIRARSKLREGLDRFDRRTKEAEAVASKARSGFGVSV